MYVEEIIHIEEPLFKWQIKNLLRLMLNGIADEYVVVDRDQQVFISETKHTSPA